MNEKIQLPLFVDKTQLPTGKNHISYSELIDWHECSYRHKLKHVDKLHKFDASIHTIFGHVLHGALETYVVTGKTPSTEECVSEFKEKVGELLFTDRAKTAVEAQEFIDALPHLLEQGPKFLDKEFPGWKLVSAEEQLFEPINGQVNKYFKGFIDLVIKVPKKKTVNKNRLSGLKGDVVPGVYIYYIIDWKTTNWGWQTKQKRSFEKHMQLILYKHFWCKKHDIDLEDVRCGFGFLRRKPMKDGTRVSILPISVGPKAVDKALKVLHDGINQIRGGRTIKNRYNCMWCPYKHTVLCP